MTNRAASVLRLTGLAVATLLAAGCGVFSPIQTDYPYIPADGVSLSVPGLDLRNLAVISDGAGSEGVLIGQAVNPGAEAVEVLFGVPGADGSLESAGGRTAVPAYSGAALSDATTAVGLGSVAAAPGEMTQLIVTTEEAGQNVVLVPVLPRDSYYSDLATPVPSATPTEG
ncbi:hypothetical protein [uncultured Phycicoccus sp.]|uniref:hypothetical protein n=1 Tax=uncultured Phycicoccus sp. TaxID=661422 RepID=UPI0026149DFD|nr:hypothetical protein [uncultured Phycicoccus sp.]